MKLSSGSVVTNDLTARLGALAHKSNVTIVGVTETVPSGESYQNWMLQLFDGTKFLSLAATRGSPWAGHEAADQQDSCSGRQQWAAGPARARGGRSPRQPACHAKTGAMHLADRGYDADWIRALVSEHGACADLPPRRNRKDGRTQNPAVPITRARGCDRLDRSSEGSPAPSEQSAGRVP